MRVHGWSVPQACLDAVSARISDKSRGSFTANEITLIVEPFVPVDSRLPCDLAQLTSGRLVDLALRVGRATFAR